MQASNAPTAFPIPFANNAGAGYIRAIPQASQIGVIPGAASLTDGFPPLNFLPVNAGGVPPFGQDMNGILNEISLAVQWMQAGYVGPYNSTFSTAIGGYPKGALIPNANYSGAWMSTADNNTTNPDTGGAGWSAAFMSGVVGQMRNLNMSVSAANSTATLTADEIVVGGALGGQKYVLPNFSKTINLATTGAGGMDTGSAPTSGYVALYAIYNPTTSAAALLAKNATSAVQPNVYGGANMPAGYTASALVSVWPTNGSGQFVVGFQRDRSISINSVTVLSTSATQASPTALSVSSAIPPNAVGISGTIAASSSAAATTSIQLNPIASINVGIQGINFSSTSASGGGSSGVFRNLQVSSPQTIYYTSSNSAGTPTYAIAVMGYDF